MSSTWGFGSKTQKCKRKRLLIVAAEGEVTEENYFSALNSMSQDASFHVVENRGNGSDPGSVLTRMKNFLKQNKDALEENDEAWIVIDEDDWSTESIAPLENWVRQNSRRNHLAISKRRFEHWLRLHVSDPQERQQYKDLLQGKDKHIPVGFIRKDRVLAAADQARRLKETRNSVGNVYELIDVFFNGRQETAPPAASSDKSIIAEQPAKRKKSKKHCK